SNLSMDRRSNNFSRPSPLKDAIVNQNRINESISKKLLANDKILEAIDSKMETFASALQNQLSHNKMLETQISQLAAAVLPPNAGKFPGQPEAGPKEEIKGVATRGGKTTQD